MAGRSVSPGVVHEHMSTGFSFPWEQAAMRGDEMPDGLSLPDQLAYTAMRNIYLSYHNKIISRDAAAAEKRRIRKEYERAVEQLAFADKLAEHRARQLRDTEKARTACRKNPTPENTARLCNILDGLNRGYTLEMGVYGIPGGAGHEP